jgi:hypothetical protein
VCPPESLEGIPEPNSKWSGTSTPGADGSVTPRTDPDVEKGYAVLATSESFAPSRAKKWALFGLGLLLALVAFGTTLAIGPLQYHPA